MTATEEEEAKTARIVAALVEQGTTMRDSSFRIVQYPPADRGKEFNMEECRLIQIWDQLMVKEGVLYGVFIGRGNNESYLQLIAYCNLS